jgi:hypothetical protein
VVGGWRRLHNEEQHNLCASPNIIKAVKSRRMRWVKHVTHIGEIRNAYKILVRKHEGKRPLRRPSCTWEDNIRMYLREIGWEVVDWIYLAQDRDQWRAPVNTVMSLWFHKRQGIS